METIIELIKQIKAKAIEPTENPYQCLGFILSLAERAEELAKRQVREEFLPEDMKKKQPH